jgi:hypothetical protein
MASTKTDRDPWMEIDGARGSCPADGDSDSDGRLAPVDGGPACGRETAAVSTAVMRTPLAGFDLMDDVEELLTALGSHYQVIRPPESRDALFLYYLVLDRRKDRQAISRYMLCEAARDASV